MELTAWIIAALGTISAALGVVNILDVLSEPILSDKLTWIFWFALAGILFLVAIFFMVGRKQNYPED